MSTRPNTDLFFVSIAAATAAGFGAAWLYFSRRRNSSQQEEEDVFRIPFPLHSCPYSRELSIAIPLALQCGSPMYKYCNDKGTAQEGTHDLGIATKSTDTDFCTAVDIANEHRIVAALKKHFPEHAIIGEEAVGTGVIPQLSKTSPTWIIDPVDGTTNFAAGLPLTCVSIGMCNAKGQPVLGVVYAPMTRELYVGVKGYGAYRNGIQLSKRNNSRHPNQMKSLAQSIVCFEWGYARVAEAIDWELAALKNVLQNGYRAIKTFGSGVLDLCYVASGRLDVVYAGVHPGGTWKPWDYCAGLVLVQETGGVVESIDQKVSGTEHFDLYSNSIICAVDAGLLEETRKLIIKGRGASFGIK